MKQSKTRRGAKEFLEVVKSLEQTTKKLEQSADSLHNEVRTERDSRDLHEIMEAQIRKASPKRNRAQ